MFRKLYNLVAYLLSFKIFFWVQPDAKKFIKGVIITFIFILLVIYSHNEYLKWMKLSNSKEFLSLSFLLKNILIFSSLVILFLYLKRKNVSVVKNKIEGEDNIYTKEKGENYFDKFRNRELKSKTEQLLSRKNERDN